MKRKTYIALLRGINVGGRNKLPMKRLVSFFEDHGARECRTYIQSGNVVFEASVTGARRIPEKVSRTIADSCGFEPPIIARSAEELERIIRDNPYVKGADPKILHVGFLADRPTSEKAASLDPDRSPGDEFTFRNSEIYLKLPNGVARTKLTNVYFDSKLDTVTTVRNWKTTCRLLEMANE